MREPHSPELDREIKTHCRIVYCPKILGEDPRLPASGVRYIPTGVPQDPPPYMMADVFVVKGGQ